MSNDSDETIIFQRILVGVDTSQHSLAALEAAAHIARQLKADIHGIFVQDESWQKLEELPSIGIVNELTGKTDLLQKQNLNNQVERLKRRLKRQVKTISRKHKIGHRWDTVRGRVEEEILRAASEADLITIGRRGISFPGRKAMGSSAQKIIESADQSILILKKGIQIGTPITVVYDASHASQRALKLGLSLSQQEEEAMTILVMGNTSKKMQSRNAEIEQKVEEASVPINIQLFRDPSTWGFIHAVNHRNPGLLIVPRHQPLLQDNLEVISYQLHCPLLLMSE